MAPFEDNWCHSAFMTSNVQISTLFLDDLKKMAYYMELSVFHWIYEFDLDDPVGIDELRNNLFKVDKLA